MPHAMRMLPQDGATGEAELEEVPVDVDDEELEIDAAVRAGTSNAAR